MRVVESDMRLNSSHEAEFRQTREVQSTTTFRAIYQDVQADPGDARQTLRARLEHMLEALVDAILAAMDGKKCRPGGSPCRPAAPAPASELASELASPARRPAREMDWEVQTRQHTYDYERTRVEGAGVVKTADGRDIDFRLQAEFCREYSCTTEIRESGKAVLTDPIVLNFDGKAADLTADRIDFDLDADGRSEWLPGLGAGSGYLVLDRNGNGRVDDGKELFGTATGDGFADMARLDDDGNGWLDEGDAAFTHLQLWDGRPGEATQALASRQVGAIWLGSVNSPFALKDSGNQLLGEIRAAGLYLQEDGRAGMVQQVDLARQAAPGAEPDGGTEEQETKTA